jgi:phosphoadenosine phosphosulfate reductase
LVGLSPVQRIARLRQEIPGKVTFTTSFGTEDQAILHWISSLQADIDVVTLDTGRLFPETYDLWAETERRYGRKIRAIYPRYDKLAELVAQQGINGFYESKDARLACCHVRKVEPLNRALAGANAWITGLRGNQSTYRAGMGILRVDAEQGLLKLNPLFDWKAQAVLDFCQSNGVPTNRLSAKGFASIGCAPCTRAIAPGEPERAGRWWWEQEDKKECGLHISVP